ncbi:U1 small nuclear ribonucleoprotein C [Babesia microti strain RI]|uniref:U1 small nuclear ribonucleoprotein C n=1 Tax=Babesia microti (strain RI) TaxID=1133968 RepID=A0A1N6LWY2_BABMR|nr:U1 small nuclear ribonucleoprotein C [Babesia microti strain RI]SIO73377.1 U1 small nuclear ribonucleoprotein C [Babesia microti strain RI]|eukprot:XP_021337478.1 U1 small nuclear ribonucleoprotein C [Babesia microti strain RI]
MPKFYCEYCNIYLTHSSPAGRKQHSQGKKHINAKIEYYQNLIRERGFQPPTTTNPLVPFGLPPGLPFPPPFPAPNGLPMMPMGPPFGMRPPGLPMNLPPVFPPCPLPPGFPPVTPTGQPVISQQPTVPSQAPVGIPGMPPGVPPGVPPMFDGMVPPPLPMNVPQSQNFVPPVPPDT